MMEHYGKELIIDLHHCDSELFTRKMIKVFLEALCDLVLHMKREDLHFWDYEGEPKEYKAAPDHLKGTSAVQFIRTSNVTIHTLDVLGQVYINIFSCKDFKSEKVKQFCAIYFKGIVVNAVEVNRI